MANNDTTVAPSYTIKDGRLPYSGSLHSIIFVILVVSLIVPPSILSSSMRRWLFLPIVAISSHLLFRTTTGDVTTDVGMGPHLACELAMCLDYIVLCDPRITFKLKSDEKEKRKQLHKETLWEHIKCTLLLLSSPRGVGWTHEPSPHILPPRPKPSTTRTTFVTARIAEAILCICLEAGTYILNAYNPALTNPSVSMMEHAFHLRALAVLVYACKVYSSLNLIYAVVSAVSVTLRLSRPEEWPQLFGSVWESWSVGRFWSRTWHHVLRRTLTSTTNTILPPKKNSGKAYMFSRLMCAFIISGILHEMGEHMMAGKFSAGSLWFFFLQPFAIFAEQVVFMFIGVSSESLNGKSKKPSFAIRALGYIWVLVWFVTTGPIVIDPIVPTGMFVHRKENRNLGAVALKWLKSSGK